MDSDTESWDITDLQRSKEFIYVGRHLGEYLADSESFLKTRSWSLSYMVWRAALVFGTDEEFEKAFDLCIRGRGRGVVIGDLAGRGLRDRVRDRVLAFASEESLISLMNVLQNEDPSSWGEYDYTPMLITLMENGKTEKIRMYAAYCLARWSGESDVGNRAMSVLRNPVKEKWLSGLLLDGITSLGRHGWERAENCYNNLPASSQNSSQPSR